MCMVCTSYIVCTLSNINTRTPWPRTCSSPDRKYPSWPNQSSTTTSSSLKSVQTSRSWISASVPYIKSKNVRSPSVHGEQTTSEWITLIIEHSPAHQLQYKKGGRTNFRYKQVNLDANTWKAGNRVHHRDPAFHWRRGYYVVWRVYHTFSLGIYLVELLLGPSAISSSLSAWGEVRWKRDIQRGKKWFSIVVSGKQQRPR